MTSFKRGFINQNQSPAFLIGQARLGPSKKKKKKLLHGNMGVLEQNYQGHQSRFLSPYAN